jgi:hypothetical protein
MKKALALIAMLFGFVPAVLCAGSGPKIEFKRLAHDFGEIVHPESASVELSFTNAGDEELVVERISSSCGCAKAVRGSRRLAPGSASTVEARIETLGMTPGPHTKTVMIHSNDPAHPTTSLKLMFNVVRRLSVMPEIVSTGVLASEKSAVFPLRAVNYWTQPITLKAAQAVGSAEAVLVPQEVLVPAGGHTDFQLSVPVKQDAPQPYMKGIALLETTDPQEKTVPVRYFIQLQKTSDN